MKRRLSIGLASLLGLLVIAGGSYYLLIKKPEAQSVSSKPHLVAYEDAKTGARLQYPDNVNVSQVSEEDKKANITLRLTEKEGQTPMLVTLRSESGLKIVANLTKVAIIDTLMSNSDKALPQRFQGFRKESSRRFERDGRKAGEIIFTYDSRIPDVRNKQRLIVLVKDDDTALYLTLQSKEVDFQKKNKEVFDPIVSSLSLQ